MCIYVRIAKKVCRQDLYDEFRLSYLLVVFKQTRGKNIVQSGSIIAVLPMLGDITTIAWAKLLVNFCRNIRRCRWL